MIDWLIDFHWEKEIVALGPTYVAGRRGGDPYGVFCGGEGGFEVTPC